MIRFGMWLEENGWEFYDSEERMIYMPTREVQLTSTLFEDFKKENPDP